jgi:hypothetical protein
MMQAWMTPQVALVNAINDPLFQPALQNRGPRRPFESVLL